MNISHHHGVGNNSRVTSAHFPNSHKALARVASLNSSNPQELHQKLHTSKITKPRATRLEQVAHEGDVAGFVHQTYGADNTNHEEQSLSELSFSKTIMVVISFLKLSKYDDEWLKLGKQLLLLKRVTDKQRCYRAAQSCFESSIKAHPDNYVAYYFGGITLCLLGRYEEAVRMFLSSIRKNTETSTVLLHTLSEMLSITEGIRLATGGSDASVQQCFASNNRDSIFNKNLDKLERAITNKLQRCKIDGAAGNMTNSKQRVTNGSKEKSKISVSEEQEQEQETWSRYFELGMYWFGREQGDHKALMYFRRCLQLNLKNEAANYYVGRILQNQGRYFESLEAYKRAISLRPDEGFYYYMASQVYTALEESKEAIEMIDKAIALSPEDIAYQNMKEQIFRAFGIESDIMD